MRDQVHASLRAFRTDWSTAAAPTAAAIAADGHALMPGFVDPDWLAVAREYAGTLTDSDRHEVMLHGPELPDHGVLRAVTGDDGLHTFLDTVAATLHPAGGSAVSAVDISLRVINGPDPRNRPLWFHYDASVLTVVVPIDIPTGVPGACGELILYPNNRPFRRTALANVLEKSVVQSDAVRSRGRLLGRPFDVIALRPGQAYIFCGYRGYHATLPVAPGMRRVTLILHYRDVHAGSRLIRGAKALRRRVVRPAG